MYLALGERVGYALIGSNNLTAGGLWHNYETGVVAIFDPRRSPERGQVIVTCGRGRPLTGRCGTAGRMARQLARIRASGPRSARRRTVARPAVARKVPVMRRPSRRSRLRAEGRTNRAAGRAAYFAAMLCSMARNGSGSPDRCK